MFFWIKKRHRPWISGGFSLWGFGRVVVWILDLVLGVGWVEPVLSLAYGKAPLCLDTLLKPCHAVILSCGAFINKGIWWVVRSLFRHKKRPCRALFLARLGGDFF